MHQKRKLIKKTHVAPPQESEELKPTYQYEDLIQQIKSHDTKIKEDAISALANLEQIPDDRQFQEGIFSDEVIRQLVGTLLSGIGNGIRVVTLFAINNLCHLENQPQKPLIPKLFKSNLSQALQSLDTSTPQILQPLLTLLSTLSPNIPQQHRSLICNVQKAVIQCPQTYLKEQLRIFTLEFLVKSKYRIENGGGKENVGNEEVRFLEALRNVVQGDRMFGNRGVAAVLLVSCTRKMFPECITIFTSLFQQLISQLDLQKQYQLNFKPHPSPSPQQHQQQWQQCEQQCEQQQCEQQNNKMTEQPNNIHTLPISQKQKSKQQQESYNIFMDALEAVQQMFQFVIEVYEEQNGYQEQEEEEEEMGEEEMEEGEGCDSGDSAMFIAMMQTSIQKVSHMLPKFTNLSFKQGQNIIQLVLHLLLLLPESMLTSQSPNLASIAQPTLLHLLKSKLQNPHLYPQQNFIENIKLCLQLIVKYKSVSTENRNVYPELPYLKYEGSGKMMIEVNGKWKEVWMLLLEIYSIFYNPEKNAVGEQDNAKIGGTLKKLIIQIPEIELEEWRAQTIDTLFDVYSNENFDKIFMNLGFVQILNQILKVSSKTNSEKKKKNQNKNNFINAVISDIKRFLEYKKKMIGF